MASIRAVLGSGGEGRPPVHRYSGGGAVCHRGGCGPAQRHLYEEHGTLSQAAQTQVRISTGSISSMACIFFLKKHVHEIPATLIFFFVDYLFQDYFYE